MKNTINRYAAAIIAAIKDEQKAHQAPAHVEPLPLMPNYSNRFKPAIR